MGYLLKEALKILCGLNQWSYAVFWKFGCQNSKLLIWEEYFYEPVYSNLPGNSRNLDSEPGFDNRGSCQVSAEACSSQPAAAAGDKVHALVNKMMMENYVNVVGEGLVGRAAFTGNHQWVLSENCSIVAHPPEVLKELYRQFSAGMQTVAVVPVLPHGVVQLGSSMGMLENLGFINDVKTLVQQLGCGFGVLLPDNYTTEPAPNVGLPVYPGKKLVMDSSARSDAIDSIPFSGSCNNQVGSTQSAGFVGQTHPLTGQVLDGMRSTDAAFQTSNMSRDLGNSYDGLCQEKMFPLLKSNLPSMDQLLNGVTKAEVVSSHHGVSLNQQASMYSQISVSKQQSSFSQLAADSGSSRLLERRILMDAGSQNHTDNNFSASDVNSLLPAVPMVDSIAKVASVNSAGNGFLSANSFNTEGPSSHMMVNLTNNHLQPGGSVRGSQSDNVGVKTETNEKDGPENEFLRGIGIPQHQHDEHINLSHGDEAVENGAKSGRAMDGTNYEGVCMQHQSGNDLFDVLGVNYRNKLLNESGNSSLHNGSYASRQEYQNISTSFMSQNAASDVYSVNQGTLESGIFCVTGSDNLLDAVVSNFHPSKQNMEDNVSCKTSLTNISNSSGVSNSHSCSKAGFPDQMAGELFDLPKSLFKAGSLGSVPFKSRSSKDNSGTYSQSSSIYGSQISSCIEQNHDIKQSSSISTAYSMKPVAMNKTSRKRLKPGENPRPRPKDRQMIQDRVKELREIVPNGAKCSIDSLLERTIKHMLFLQSVTKHADKLKQTGESKILSNEGGLVLKDNYGGATWAYEVGSQSVVCPIIVEDLNQPRQMLVEMLCAERGLSLEIAEIIRRLGLTILKGVIETRNDKIWSRFVVEANRDVTRMEIFISLVRLLDQTAKNGRTLENIIDNDMVMASQLQQATPILASGEPCGLQ